MRHGTGAAAGQQKALRVPRLWRGRGHAAGRLRLKFPDGFLTRLERDLHPFQANLMTRIPIRQPSTFSVKPCGKSTRCKAFLQYPAQSISRRRKRGPSGAEARIHSIT
jgi:hypothetical protein